MKSKFLWYLVFINGILCCLGDSNEDYDYLKLALLWSNSYCLTNHEIYRDEVPQYFTIHGLWPERLTGDQPQDCPSSYSLSNITVENDEAELLKYWPDLSTYDVGESRNIWRKEWEKHGSCSAASLLPREYFQIALRRTSDHNLSQILTHAGIKANGRSYGTRRILEAVTRSTGCVVDIVCEADTKGNVYLSEIHQCLDHNGHSFIDCDNLAKNCDADPVFPRAPPLRRHSKLISPPLSPPS